MIKLLKTLMLIFATVSVVLLITSFLPKKEQKRPNILFILTDDQKCDAAGFAGNKIIKTPVIDALAQNGIIFVNGFCTTPICAASRASIFTGLYQRTHRFCFDTPPVADEYVMNSYPAILKSNGYKTGFVGKFGVHFQNNLDTAVFDFFKDSPMQGGYYYIINGKHVHKTDYVKDQALEFLDKYGNDAPFCLSISFNAPHAADDDPRQYIWQEEYDSLYSNVTIPKTIMSEPTYFDALPEFIKESEGRTRWYWRFDTPEKYQKMMKGYYRMITGVDDAVGKVIQKLKDLGSYENTVIIYTSDNGYFTGERGLAGKWFMYEQAIRVPFFVFDPREGGSHNVNSDKMVLNIDIAPTILDYAGVEIPETYHGSSIKPIVDGSAITWRTEFIIEHFFKHPAIPESEGIRTENNKYFRYIQFPENQEMYSLDNDSLERDNVINNKDYIKAKNNLESELDKMILQYKP